MPTSMRMRSPAAWRSMAQAVLLGGNPKRRVDARGDGVRRGPRIVADLGAVGVGVCRDHRERRLGRRPPPLGKKRPDALRVARTGEADALGARRGGDARRGPSVEASGEGLEVAEIDEVAGGVLTQRAHHGPRGGVFEAAPRGLGECFEHGQTRHGKMPCRRGPRRAPRRAGRGVRAPRGRSVENVVDGEPCARASVRTTGVQVSTMRSTAGRAGSGAPGQHVGDDSAHPRLGAGSLGPIVGETVTGGIDDGVEQARARRAAPARHSALAWVREHASWASAEAAPPAPAPAPRVSRASSCVSALTSVRRRRSRGEVRGPSAPARLRRVVESGHGGFLCRGWERVAVDVRTAAHGDGIDAPGRR